MDEYMMRELLRNRPHMTESDMMRKFQEFMESEGNSHRYGRLEDHKRYGRESMHGDSENMMGMAGYPEMDEMVLYSKMKDFHSNNKGNHFNLSYAKYEVSKMYHFENGRKYVGEKFSIEKAKEIHEKYVTVIPADTTIPDVYVAVNSTYHDFVDLFKSWFGDTSDHKLIEASITFWFRDADCTEDGKVWNYFKKD